MTDAPNQGATPHAVVTGTSSGIGRAIAERLIATGWTVTGLDEAAHRRQHRFHPTPVGIAQKRCIGRRWRDDVDGYLAWRELYGP